MKTIKEIVSLSRGRFTKGLYGVEIEVEGEHLPDPDDINHKIWRVERDGSLKTEEAWEYVMPKPKDLDGVKTSLDYLNECYEKAGSEVYDSIRAGVHVHMNVQDYNIIELMTFASCYYMLEDVLMDYCGPSRAGNLFTLRTRDAEYNLFQLYRSMSNKNLRYINTDNIRYSSLNFCSLFKYGSLEFRGMRGTRDLDAIYQWVEIIDDLREGAKQFRNPMDVLMSMSGEGELVFLHTVLPKFYSQFENKPGVQESIRQAARRIQMIAFEIDWDGMSKPNTNIFEQQEGGW